MSKYRTAELLAAKSITTAGTEPVEIKSKDVISRISVIVKLTNNGYVASGHPAKAIVKVTLQEGSNILHSMRGCYTQALAFYSSRNQPHNYVNYVDNGIASAVCPIYFGRKLWDKELALDPSKFETLILNIQHDYSLGGCTPDAATLEVWADYFDDMPVSPIGMLKGTSHWNKTLVASTSDYVTLPTDLPIRFVLPALSSDSEEPDINLDAFKLTENGDKKVIFDIGTLEYLQHIEQDFPHWIEHMEGRAYTTAKSYYCTPAKDLLFAPISSADNDSYWNAVWSGGQKRTVTPSVNGINFNAVPTGRCPHGVIPIPMGDPNEIDSWWEVALGGSRRIKLTTGGGDTSALYELLLQELLRYQ